MTRSIASLNLCKSIYHTEVLMLHNISEETRYQ